MGLDAGDPSFASASALSSLTISISHLSPVSFPEK